LHTLLDSGDARGTLRDVVFLGKPVKGKEQRIDDTEKATVTEGIETGAEQRQEQ
jgi:hypothetical protein